MRRTCVILRIDVPESSIHPSLPSNLRRLRQVVLWVFASQLSLVLITLGLALLVGVPRISTQAWAMPMAAVSLLLYLTVAALCRLNFANSKNFATAFQGAALLGAVSTVPALLACLLIGLAGLQASALILAALSVIFLLSSLGRVGRFASEVVVPAASEGPFEGWAISSEDEALLQRSLGLDGKPR